MAESLKTSTSTEGNKKQATPLRCFTGAAVSGTFSVLCYRMMIAIATSFAAKPIVSEKAVVLNISAAVRTLVVGIVALGAGVFGIAALGLLLLGIQLLIKKVAGQDATV
ncbi:MAG: DUF3082 domain-containing protein [Cyanobacteria bacterium P01_D01_bin.156]